MTEIRIKEPGAPATFRQRQAIGLALVDAAFPDGLTKGEASGWIGRLRAEDEALRTGATNELAGRALRGEAGDDREAA